jgi:hypothetical protein
LAISENLLSSRSANRDTSGLSAIMRRSSTTLQSRKYNHMGIRKFVIRCLFSQYSRW